MKKGIVYVSTLIVLLSLIPIHPVTTIKDDKVEYWFLIVGGPDMAPRSYMNTFYLFHILRDGLLGFETPRDHITWLHANPKLNTDINGTATEENVRQAITGWLNSSSDEDDFVFIYLNAHGGGFNNTYKEGKPRIGGGRIDESGDEHLDGWEEHECPNGTRFSVDECLQLGDDWAPPQNYTKYWDDQLKDDLSKITCGTLVILFQACKSENGTCYSGGFIDDLSASNRIIVTASNETSYSYHQKLPEFPDDDGFSEFSEHFFDALCGYNTTFGGGILILEEEVDADFDRNGHVSIREAFNYTLQHDRMYLAGLESPWYDDDGDGFPTFANGTDILDDDQGGLGARTYLDWIVGDIDEDGEVDVFDKVLVGEAFGATYNATDKMFWHGPPDFPESCPYCPHTNRTDLNNDGIIDLFDKVLVGVNFGKEFPERSQAGSQRVMQRGTAEVAVDPGEISVNKYGSFSVNITLSDVTDLYGWEFRLYWDNTILNCTGAQIYAPDVWGENSSEDGPGIQNDYNATHGRYWKALSGLYPATPFNGSMAMVTLTFEAKTVGSSSLDLQNTKLADAHAEAISHTAVDGSVNVLSQRYMRGDQHTVNNLNAYKLTVPQSAIHKTASDAATGRKTIYWGIRVWKRGSAGNETEITGGTPVAQVSRSNNGEGLQSNTWACPQTPLQSTDAIVVRVYMKFGSGEWQLCSTFITEQLQASQLDSVQWTVYYYTWRFYDRWESITSGSYDWGTTTYNSHIQNFQYT